MRLVSLCLGLLLLTPLAAKAELVLVYPIEDLRTGDRLSDESRAELLSVLREKVEADVAFEATEPRSSSCFKRKCLAEEGAKALAAQVLSTQISRVGNRCAVQARLVEVAKKIYKHGATRIVSCDHTGLLTGFDRVVGTLGREVRRARGDYVDVPYDQYEDLEDEELEGEDDEELQIGELVERLENNGLEGKRTFFNPQDGKDCMDSADRWACARAASGANEDGRKDLVVKYGAQGCKLGEPGACRWAIKVESEGGNKKEALVLAKQGCQQLSDGASCGWGASIEHERGNLKESMDYAQRGCSLDDADACSWAAKIEYDAGNLEAALGLTRRHCSEKKHGASCRWAASILHTQAKLEEGLRYGKLGCEGNDGASCSWAARIESDRDHQALALSHAKKGMKLRDPDAFGWVAKLEMDLGSPDKAFPAAREGCEMLMNAVSCSWATSISFDRGEREEAVRYARIGAALNDPDCHAWVAKLEHERGNSRVGFEHARKACFESRHAPSCRWAASIGYESGRKAEALKGAVKGCDYADADSCSWAAKIEHEAGHAKKALEYANRGCSMDNADACSWVRTIRGD